MVRDALGVARLDQSQLDRALQGEIVGIAGYCLVMGKARELLEVLAGMQTAAVRRTGTGWRAF